MNILHISVINKVATYQQRDGAIVCGNSDYQIEFTFDDEWNASTYKTARFVYSRGSELIHQDVDFTGNTVIAPVLTKTTEVYVGIYAGELRTSTPAVIPCKLSILCESGSPAIPSPEIDARIMQLLNTAISLEERAEQAAVKATEAAKSCGISSPAIVLSASGEGVTITDSASRTIQGLNMFGKTMQNGTPAPDAPIPLENVGDDGVMAKVEGGNLIPFPDSKSATQNGITATFKDSKITLSGTSTATVWLTAFTMSLDAGEYTLSSDSIPGKVTVYIFSNTEYFSIKSDALVKTKIFPQGNYNFVIEISANVTLNDEFRVMLNKGTTAIPYQPYSQQQIITTIPNGICGIPVTSGGNYTDANGQQWIADEIDLERGVLIKRTHTQTFKGTEPFSALGSTGDANAFFYLVDSSIKPYVVENEGFSLSSHFEAKRIISSTTDAGHQIRKVSTGEQYRVLFRPQNASGMTAAQFQTWLKSNPTTVTYALATSTEIPLSAEDIEAFKSVHTNYPTTVITSDNDAYMSVKYVVDTKTYIDNKLSELVASVKESG